VLGPPKLGYAGFLVKLVSPMVAVAPGGRRGAHCDGVGIIDYSSAVYKVGACAEAG